MAMTQAAPPMAAFGGPLKAPQMAGNPSPVVGTRRFARSLSPVPQLARCTSGDAVGSNATAPATARVTAAPQGAAGNPIALQSARGAPRLPAGPPFQMVTNSARTACSPPRNSARPPGMPGLTASLSMSAPVGGNTVVRPMGTPLDAVLHAPQRAHTSAAGLNPQLPSGATFTAAQRSMSPATVTSNGTIATARRSTSPGPSTVRAVRAPVKPLLDLARPLAELAVQNSSEYSPRDSVWKRYFCGNDGSTDGGKSPRRMPDSSPAPSPGSEVSRPMTASLSYPGAPVPPNSGTAPNTELFGFPASFEAPSPSPTSGSTSAAFGSLPRAQSLGTSGRTTGAMSLEGSARLSMGQDELMKLKAPGSMPEVSAMGSQGSSQASTWGGATNRTELASPGDSRQGTARRPGWANDGANDSAGQAGVLAVATTGSEAAPLAAESWQAAELAGMQPSPRGPSQPSTPTGMKAAAPQAAEEPWCPPPPEWDRQDSSMMSGSIACVGTGTPTAADVSTVQGGTAWPTSGPSMPSSPRGAPVMLSPEAPPLAPAHERVIHERGAPSAGSTPTAAATAASTATGNGGDTAAGATSAGAYVVHACAEAITVEDLRELRELPRPHAAVREVVETTLMLLGYRESKWSAAQACFDRPEAFLEKMRNFDAAQSVSRLQFQKLCRSLSGPHGTFEEGYAESFCNACGGFVHWCRAVYEVLAWRFGGTALGKVTRGGSGKMSARTQSPPTELRTLADQTAAGAAEAPAPSGRNASPRPVSRGSGRQAPAVVSTAPSSSGAGPDTVTNDEHIAIPGGMEPVAEMPTCVRPDLGLLEINPDIYSLSVSELTSVKNLTIRKAGVGEVCFHGELDLMHERRVLEELPAIIRLEPGEVVLYPDPGTKPPEGDGLNRPATITLFQCMPPNNGAFPDADSKNRYRERIARMTEQKGARFVDYDCDNGIWRFRVDHF